ncbi:MAG: nuclear transport factor 2 family protein [Pseudomonadota bacterium]
MEESLFEPAVRQDAEQLDAVLHDEFTEIGMSGRRYDKRSIMNLLHDSTKTTFQAIGQNYQFIELADGLVQLMYESANLEEGGELVNHARRTSIWQNESGHWKIKYHQGTATEPFERSK